MITKFKQKPLQEQVIVITGGSSGIGLATAKLAGSKGARVVIASNNESELREAGEKLKKEGHKIERVTADVSDFKAVEKIGNFAIQKFGRIDTWINNAGIHIFGKIEENEVEDMRRLFEVNYWGTVYGCRTAVKHMKTSGGTIINIGSVLSSRSVPLQGAYGASKHAVEGYTDALRMELEKTETPVVLTLIKPSAINTPITEHSKNIMPEKARLPFPLYDPEVAADAILFCAEHPRRTFTIGAAGKAATEAEKFFPAAVDKAMETFVWNMQKAKGEPQRKHSLYEPAEHDPRTRGEDNFYTRTYSLYNTAIKHPVVTTGLLSLGSMFLYSTFNGRK